MNDTSRSSESPRGRLSGPTCGQVDNAIEWTVSANRIGRSWASRRFVRRGDYHAQFVIGEFGQRGDDRQQVGAHRFMRDRASLVAADPADSEGYNPADSEAGKGVHREQLEIPG